MCILRACTVGSRLKCTKQAAGPAGLCSQKSPTVKKWENQLFLKEKISFSDWKSQQLFLLENQLLFPDEDQPF
jgi:hypothetical protein